MSRKNIKCKKPTFVLSPLALLTLAACGGGGGGGQSGGGGGSCLSPLELCQYILAKGVRKHGSKALF